MGVWDNAKRLAVIGAGSALYPTVHGLAQQFLGGLGGEVAGFPLTKLLVFFGAAYGIDKVPGWAKDLVAGIGVGAFADLISPYVGGLIGTTGTQQTTGATSLEQYVAQKYGI